MRLCLKSKKLGLLAGSTAVTTATTAHAMKKEADKTTYTAELMSAIKPRKMGFYEKYIKRGMDVICASAAILCLYVPHFRANCETCGSKLICNGCSDCGKCL